MILTNKPLPGAYSASAYNVLDRDVVTVTERALELERTAQSISRLRRELKELHDNRPASTDDVLTAMTHVLGESTPLSVSDRRTRLKAIATEFAESFRHAGVGRQYKQANAAPALRALYTAVAADQLRDDFSKLETDLEDKSIDHGKKVTTAESQLKKLTGKLADLESEVLLSFKDGVLPQYRGLPRSALLAHFHLPATSTDAEIGKQILLQFL